MVRHQWLIKQRVNHSAPRLPLLRKKKPISRTKRQHHILNQNLNFISISKRSQRGFWLVERFGCVWSWFLIVETFLLFLENTHDFSFSFATNFTRSVEISTQITVARSAQQLNFILTSNDFELKPSGGRQQSTVKSINYSSKFSYPGMTARTLSAVDSLHSGEPTEHAQKYRIPACYLLYTSNNSTNVSLDSQTLWLAQPETGCFQFKISRSLKQHGCMLTSSIKLFYLK